MWLADQRDQIVDVPAAGAFDVVGVHRPAANRRDRLFELAALMESVGVKAELNVVSLTEVERRGDDLRVGREVLMDFEPGTPHLEDEALGCTGSSVRAVACRPMLTGSSSNASTVRCQRQTGSSQPAVIRVVMPPESAEGIRRGVKRWTWLSIAPGVAIRPWAAITSVCGPIRRRCRPSSPDCRRGRPR